MIADRIKFLREQRKLTQTDLSMQLGITRSSVNAWELGISVPSTRYIVELAGIFKVSTDFLLGVDRSSTLSVEGLTEADVRLIDDMVCHLRKKNKDLELI